MTTAAAVRKGHLRALEQLELSDGYSRTRELYREALGGVGVYLRPTAAGFTVLSLDARRCASMIGVGGGETGDHSIRRLPPDPASVRKAVAGYHAKRGAPGRSSVEETYALELVSAALDSSLSLPRAGVHMLVQEWRLPSGARPDLIAADLRGGTIVVVELKDSEARARATDTAKGRDAWGQARHTPPRSTSTAPSSTRSFSGSDAPWLGITTRPPPCKPSNSIPRRSRRSSCPGQAGGFTQSNGRTIAVANLRLAGR